MQQPFPNRRPSVAACGQALAADAKFCPGCGKKQEATSDANTSTMDKLKSTAAGFLKR
jgi:hypothetical protein